jgi:toxin FitB
MIYLIDTNVLSEIRKSRPDPNVMHWFHSVALDQCAIGVITLGEIRRGIEKRKRTDAAYAVMLEQWLAYLEHAYEGRIWAFDRASAEQWGRLPVKNAGQMIDAQLAAIAILRHATLVTRNTKDFAAFNVPLINPFERIT